MSSKAVQDWRSRTKQRMVDAMGGCCQICGYDRCLAALEFHHLDPSQKELKFSQSLVKPSAWKKIVDELKKSILLCATCHREYHAGFVDLPETYQKFDDTYTDYSTLLNPDKICESPLCSNNLNYTQRKFCSVSCHNDYKRSQKIHTDKNLIDWSDLYHLKYVKKYSNVKIGNIKNCTEAAVRKRLKTHPISS